MVRSCIICSSSDICRKIKVNFMRGTCSMPFADCGSHIIVGTDKEVAEGRRNICEIRP
jgi:hypothetical protein